MKKNKLYLLENENFLNSNYIYKFFFIYYR